MKNDSCRDPILDRWADAVIRGDVKVVADILAIGFNPDALLPRKAWSALTFALRNQDEALVRLLLTNGADPNLVCSVETTPVTDAIELARRSPELGKPQALLELLLAAGGKLRVLEAVVMEDVELARERLENGEDPDYGRGSYHGPLLMRASKAGHLGLVDLLIEHGADIEARDDLGQRSLICAAEQGHLEVVGRLLDRGAEIDALDGFRRSALACAAANEHGEVCRILLARGATRGVIDSLVLGDLERFAMLLDERLGEGSGDQGIYTGDAGRLSMLAIRSGSLLALEMLLKRGVAVCYPGRDRHSLLAEAAIYGRLEAIELLLGYGADVHEIGRDGTTPLAWAIEAKQFGAADLLRKAGAVR